MEPAIPLLYLQNHNTELITVPVKSKL